MFDFFPSFPTLCAVLTLALVGLIAVVSGLVWFGLYLFHHLGWQP